MAFLCIRCKAALEQNFKACPHCGEPVTEFVRRYSNELLDGKYRLVERLGAGGMGEVFKANHTYLDAMRVIKVIRPQIADSGEAHDRFLREARLATKVQHPNVATVHDFSALPDGSHYMVFEYIDGENLTQFLRRRGTLQPAEAIDITTQALAGLDAIHRAGIVHRDISPENLMVERASGRVKIIDLGVAKADDSSDAATRTGMFLGKLRYASPEHLGVLREGEKIDGRADLYSLGVVLYEALTGRPPFEGTSPHQYLLHHSSDDQPRQLDLTKVPAALQPVLGRALERDRDKRFANARAFSDALTAITTKPTVNAPLDLESTMRVEEQPTLRREVKPAVTEIDPTPAPVPMAAAGGGARRHTLIIVIAAVVMIIAAVFLIARREPESKPLVALPETTTTRQPQVASTSTSTAPAPTPTPASATTVDVAPPPTTTTQAPVKAKPTPTPQPTPVPTPAPQPVPREVPAPPTPQPAPAAVHAYTEGGDSDVNGEALEHARAQLHDVTRVTVTGGGDPALQAQLEVALRRSGLTVANGTEVLVNFSGSLEHLGRGRKRRSAHAVVTKNGHVVFRYEMPAEEYRVGDTPAEAFARVLNEALGR